MNDKRDMIQKELDGPAKPCPHVYWYRVKIAHTRTKRQRDSTALDVLRTIYAKPGIDKAEMVTDAGLMNLIQSGIQDAFIESDREDGDAI